MEIATKKQWMDLYGTPDAPKPDETGWTGFSHPTKRQWSQLWGSWKALAKIENAKGELEIELHQRFAADRVRGEWFRLSPEIQAYIDEINRGAT